MEDQDQTISLWYTLGVPETFAKLNSRDYGLSSEEAHRRSTILGLNRLPEQKTTSIVTIFLRQFQSPLIYILVLAAIVELVLGQRVDAGIIISILVINALVGALQEGKAEKTFTALSRFTKTDARVTRSGKETLVDDTELVPGDIIYVQEGDKIPADARILRSNNFASDQSALTGESEAVIKDSAPLTGANITIADQTNMIFKGTLAVSGNARALVTETGTQTVIGKISTELKTIDSEVPLKKSIRDLSRVLSLAIVTLCILVFALGLLYGRGITEMFLSSVAIAVSLIPEGLPIVLTLILATGVYRMSRQNALVKKLQAVEALGQAEVIAVDKTGTITKNELTVGEVFIDGKEFIVSGSGYDPVGQVSVNDAPVDSVNHPELLLAGKVASLCANAHVSYAASEKVWKVSGDPTEAALLVFGEKIGFRKDVLDEESPLIFDVPFDTKNKYHLSVHTVNERNFMTVVGAPESVMALSKHYWTKDGVVKMTQKEYWKIEAAIKRMSQKGYRILAFSINENAARETQKKLPDLTFIGLFGMKDVLREGVRESIQMAKDNGIRVVMITGDHKQTAETIAKDAGIFREGDMILSGSEIEAMSDDELIKILPSVSVFARVSPEHKLKIIESYKKRGEIIAMTGDGVNDALSLVAADLGVAMGKIGTEVTKEAADIVLLDDNFKSIVSAIEEGRNIYTTIRKVLLYLFSTGFGELLVIIGALLLAWPLPLLPSQIIWLNLVTDGFLVVAMAMEPKDPLEKHHTRQNWMIDRLMVWRILFMGFVMSIGTLFVFRYYSTFDFTKALTMSLTTVAVFQWFNAWNCRSRTRSVFSTHSFQNLYLAGATVLVIILQLFAIYSPLMHTVLKTTPLDYVDWVVVLLVSSSIILFEEIRKWSVRSAIWNDQKK
ncbi:cation-transporting P-type ATPase [Candidatus Parcubacteria bacterium]|nr:cation-transporting P-type ATPase [Candidatus Parcubacteria bacterium]